jgi:hypothetical protein
MLDEFQSGFRPAHNTTTALLHIADEIKESGKRGLELMLTGFCFSQNVSSGYTHAGKREAEVLAGRAK